MCYHRGEANLKVEGNELGEAITLATLFVPNANIHSYAHNFSLLSASRYFNILMGAASDLVGRVAQLHNIVSKPELNGAYVLVHAYLQEKNRYLVETLLPPNTNDRTINMSVKVTVCWGIKLH